MFFLIKLIIYLFINWVFGRQVICEIYLHLQSVYTIYNSSGLSMKKHTSEARPRRCILSGTYVWQHTLPVGSRLLPYDAHVNPMHRNQRRLLALGLYPLPIHVCGWGRMNARQHAGSHNEVSRLPFLQIPGGLSTCSRQQYGEALSTPR